MFHSMLVAKWTNSVSTGDSVMLGYVETNRVETNDKFKLFSINRILEGSQVESSSDITL